MMTLSPIVFAESLDTLVVDWISERDALRVELVEVYADGSVCFHLGAGRKIWPKYQPDIRERIKHAFYK